MSLITSLYRYSWTTTLLLMSQFFRPVYPYKTEILPGILFFRNVKNKIKWIYCKSATICTQCNQGHGSEPITTQAHMLQILPCYNMFILFIADSMGVSESLEGRYLQNLCQVIKSSVCPQKDRIIGAEIVSLRTMPHWFSFFAGECSLLLPTVSHLTASIGFQWSFQALGCLCGSSWHHMLCLCCAGFYFFILFEELICDVMLYLMVLYRNLLHSLFNWWLKSHPQGDIFVTGKWIGPFGKQNHNTKFSHLFYQMECMSSMFDIFIWLTQKCHPCRRRYFITDNDPQC